MSARSSQPLHTGGCLCGAVRYEVRGPLREVVVCHCQQCRRTHGHYAAYTASKARELVLTGFRELKWYQSSTHARRGFCAQCGASLFWQRLGSDSICIAAGTLDEPTGLATTRQVYVADAGDYYDIDADLESFPGSMEED